MEMSPSVPAGTRAALPEHRSGRGVQRRDIGLGFPCWPRGQIVQRLVGNRSDIERIALGTRWDIAAAGLHRKRAAAAASEEGSTQRPGRIAGVGDAAGGERKESQRRGCSCRRKVAVDVEDYLRGVTDENADTAVGACGRDRCVGLDASVGVQRRDVGLRLAGRPNVR